MRALFALIFCLPLVSFGQGYVSGGLTAYDGNRLNISALSAEVGYVHGPFDVSMGIAEVKTRTPLGAINYNALFATAQAHVPVNRYASGFVGYQVTQDQTEKFSGRPGLGIAFHFNPIKAALIWTPTYDGKPQMVGLSVKVRY